jgi:hypothetical protein
MIFLASTHLERVFPCLSLLFFHTFVAFGFSRFKGRASVCFSRVNELRILLLVQSVKGVLAASIAGMNAQ